MPDCASISTSGGVNSIYREREREIDVAGKNVEEDPCSQNKL